MKKVIIFLTVLFVLIMLAISFAEETATVYCRNAAFTSVQIIPPGEVNGFYRNIEVGRLVTNGPYHEPCDEFVATVSSFRGAKVIVGFTAENNNPRLAIFQLHDGVDYNGSNWILAVTQSDMKVTLQTDRSLQDSTGILTGMDFKYPDDDQLLNPPPVYATADPKKKEFKAGDWCWYTDADHYASWPDHFTESRFGGHEIKVMEGEQEQWLPDTKRYEWGALILAAYWAPIEGLPEGQKASTEVIIFRVFFPGGYTDDFRVEQSHPEKGIVVIGRYAHSDLL
jgi:hypothetical protein